MEAVVLRNYVYNELGLLDAPALVFCKDLFWFSAIFDRGSEGYEPGFVPELVFKMGFNSALTSESERGVCGGRRVRVRFFMAVVFVARNDVPRVR